MPDNRFLRYCVIGLSGVTIDLVVFVLLYRFLDVQRDLANFISVSCGILNNFVLNVRYNFRVRDRLLARFLSFYAVGAIGIGLTSLMFWLLVDHLGFDTLVTKVLSLFVVVVTQYSLNRAVSFRQSSSPTT